MFYPNLLENPLMQKPTNFSGTSCLNTNLHNIKNVTGCIMPNVTFTEEKEKKNLLQKILHFFKF
jgi:hypothetical protein